MFLLISFNCYKSKKPLKCKKKKLFSTKLLKKLQKQILIIIKTYQANFINTVK